MKIQHDIELVLFSCVSVDKTFILKMRTELVTTGGPLPRVISRRGIYLFSLMSLDENLVVNIAVLL